MSPAAATNTSPFTGGDRDREHFLDLVADMVSRFHVRLHGYVLMDNHSGLVGVPRWLECQTVPGLGGGSKAEQRRRYREYVESAVRAGLPESPGESVREQVVLGGAQILKELKQYIAGDKQEPRGARRLMAEPPTFAALVAAWMRSKGAVGLNFGTNMGTVAGTSFIGVTSHN